MKDHYKLISFFVFILPILVSCNQDPLQKADEAYKDGNWIDAQKYYQEALQQNPNDNALKEKIILTYYKTGEDYYQTRKLVRAFEGQVHKGLAELPPNVSNSTKTATIDILVKLALAYKNEPPTKIQDKQHNLNKCIYYLETALEYDSTNTTALAELEKLDSEEINEFLEKGNLYFSAGAKNPQHYLTAEYFYLKALEIDPRNKEARKQLWLARKKGLNILYKKHYSPIAIKKKYEIDELLAFDIIIKNNTNRVMPLKGDNFFLIAPDNTRYQGFFSEDFTMPFVTKNLAPGDTLKGVVTFEAPPKNSYATLEYDGGGKFQGHKNLP
jgi:tetratricopeptide (TPR) repeat protein